MKTLIYSCALAFGAFAAQMIAATHLARSPCRQDKKLRENLDESQIDQMVMDSFPASDPPSTY